VLLISLLVAMTVMMILLTASAQSWATIMQRERELELLFRGNQYVIALQQYAKEHGGAYPLELDDLMKEGPMGHRYIRQRFKDPFDPDGDWNLLYLAPNGRGAINPNARFPEGGAMGVGQIGTVPGGAGVMGSSPGQSAGGTRAGARRTALGGVDADRDGRRDAGTGLQGRDRDRDRGRDSGFGGATMTGPIVGVVSTSDERGFRNYYGRKYYDEWEFHVFQNQVVDPRRRGTGQGMNVNPGGNIGVGGGITPAGTAGPGEGPTAGQRTPDLTNRTPGQN
jgi:type II secretory pathway pseudopilin PulG